MKYKNLDFLYRNRILLAISTLFQYIADLKKLSREFLLVFLGRRLLISSKIIATRADNLVHREKKSGSTTTTGLVNTCEESASQPKK